MGPPTGLGASQEEKEITDNQGNANVWWGGEDEPDQKKRGTKGITKSVKNERRTRGRIFQTEDYLR